MGPVDVVFFVGLFIVVGLVLLIPGLWWARRKAEKEPNYRRQANFTTAGWIFIILLLLALFGGLMMPYFLPGSYIGQLTSSGFGRLVWAAGLAVIATLVQKGLDRLNIPIQKAEEKTSR